MRQAEATRFLGNEHHRSLAIGLLLGCWLGVLAPSSHAASEATGCAPGPSTRTINYGAVAVCKIETQFQGESDRFRFSATAGETILLVLTYLPSDGSVCIKLLNPFGQTEVGPNCTDRNYTSINWLISSSGTYTAEIYEFYGANQVRYTLTLDRLLPTSPAAVGMVFEQARGSEINPVGDLDIYSFNGTAGQAVKVTVYRLGPGPTPCLQSLTPALTNAAPPVCNESLESFYPEVSSSFTLPSSGTYSLLVSTLDPIAIVRYSILLHCISGCSAQPPSNLTRCVTPPSLHAYALAGTQPTERTFWIGSEDFDNCSLPGIADFTASANVLNGAGWLSVSPASGTFFPGGLNLIRATINPAAISGTGTFQAVIRVLIPSLNATIKIPVTLTMHSGPQLALSWNSFVFQTVELTAAPPAQTLRIHNTVPGTIDWTISPAELATSFPSWLSISPLSGTAGSAAGQGSRVTFSVNPAGLTAGNTNTVYNALVKVSSPTATNSPQYISITFHVVRITAAPVPLLSGYGLVFNYTQGGPVPGSQSCMFSNTGGGSITASLDPKTVSGINWLSVSITSATASTASGPQTWHVSVNPSGLEPGQYRGKITHKFTATNSSGASVARPEQDVDVLLNVFAPDAVASMRSGERAAACAPTKMDMLGATVGNGVNVPVSFPLVLLTQVIDDCGQAVTGATALAVADGQNVPLAEVGGGLYSGNWTPQKTNAAASIVFTILHPTLETVQQNFKVAAVAASGGTSLPVLFNQGVVETAGLSQGRPLVPGGIISLFGLNMAPPGTLAFASAVPLEQSLAQTSVRIGNVNAPLYFVSPQQINAQLPFEAVPGETVTVVLNVNGRLAAPQQYQIAPAQPGIFSAAGNAAVLDEQSRLITSQNPARIGKTIQIIASGLGITNPAVASGAGSPSGSSTQIAVEVTIGGVPATVVSQELVPGLVGLYQVKATVPAGVTPGDAVPLVITQNGIPSNPDLPVTLPVAP
ncbi:MAG: hypothetical protein HY651_08640 [Acidobacteria bacterium]|nr:hypothetical protein [Acidobacteriota bacterium]